MASQLRQRLVPIKKTALLASTVILAAGIVGAYTRHRSGPRLDLDVGLVDGMTEEEVINRLGDPPNSDGTTERNYDGYCLVNVSFPLEGRPKASYTKQWENEKRYLKVYFDENGRLVDCMATDYVRPLTFTERVRDFIRSLF